MYANVRKYYLFNVVKTKMIHLVGWQDHGYNFDISYTKDKTPHNFD